ncbi:kinase-like domain-containing protein [Lipomyces tetrasporus]|uniref:Kinase-like domain-containing protein n=1 Tax=Lipomyces tetrasporus TaxID=54092 RepID=A0AAD7VSV4_9ASCO|nr:kinase-like domain-containing protein [Lipomyces tetrasporus]KAJ8100778.1 kinase-like domain-containing protein [Lipomyces tetrasporus]
MFSSAIKSLSSNISSHYSISQPAVFQAGPWSVYDARRRNTGSPVSVFTFDKRKLHSLVGRVGGVATVKEDAEEICARLRKEAGYLAKLRHPAILELVEPVEEGRSSISFVTERVTACLTSVIERKASGRTGSDDEVDEVEIQKGLLQLAKGLEFLHYSAGIVHIDLVPSAIFVNAKSDWKLSGLGFAQELRNDGSREYFVPPYDPRLPPSLQFNLDYSAPELVIDHLIDPANDMFSVGCIIHAIYASRPPLTTNQNPVTYKNTISQSLRISRDQRFPNYMFEVLLQLLTRRPTDRMSSRDFQDSKYFDNILINTIRFLDELPAKTASERQAFMRGLSRVLPQFPNSVQQKKILPTLLDELDKDESMLGSILTNVLEIGQSMSQLSFSQRILPGLTRLKDVPSGQAVLLDKIEIIKSRVNGREFKEDILPLIYTALSSQSPSIQEKTLNTIPQITSNLDFPTIKNELFPQVSAVFTQTSSLAVKVAALHALEGLIGGGLDKYTISEKLVPLLRGMKTREPTVIMCALSVYELIVPKVDPSVLANDVIPHMWALAMSPLLKVDQFRQFMGVVHKASDKVEIEHTRKLAELDPEHGRRNPAVQSTGDVEADFEALVLGRTTANGKRPMVSAPREASAVHASRLAPQDNEDFEWGDIPPQPKANSIRVQGMKLQSSRQTLNALRTQKRPAHGQHSGQAQPASTSALSQQNSQLSPSMITRRQSLSNGSAVWGNSSTSSVRTTSIGSVGMSSPTNTSPEPFAQTMQPQTTTTSAPAMSPPSVGPFGRTASNGFAGAFGGQEANPWQSVTSTSNGLKGSSGDISFPLPPSRQGRQGEKPNAPSGFGVPQLLPQQAEPTQRQKIGMDKYASLL